MHNISPEALKQGFLIIPKILLQEQIINHEIQEGEIEAFLKLLLKVNYSETQLHENWNKNIPCKRGESLHSYRDWSRIFHWSRHKTCRFIKQLQKDNIIEIIPHPNNPVLHLRIINYDQWVGTPDSSPKAKKKKAVDEKFDLFWNKYHLTTNLHKENIGKAQREWKKLSENERQLAIDRIEDYYYHLTNTQYILHAPGYLLNKAFLNEYLD